METKNKLKKIFQRICIPLFPEAVLVSLFGFKAISHSP